MKNKLLLIFITLIFIIIFIFFYIGLQNTNIYTPETKIRNKIPSFKGDLFYSDETINSSNFFNSDKFYLLNVWSSWCVPCRKEHDLLMDLKEIKKLRVIGINYKDKKINAENFLSELGNPYEKIIFDQEGIIAIEWGAYGVPESFLIKDEIIIKRYIGPLDKKQTEEIKSIIK
jgi:cytochrome c biogenesis protein CcmG/thiol:disulfide interchange protein DsbE